MTELTSDMLWSVLKTVAIGATVGMLVLFFVSPPHGELATVEDAEWAQQPEPVTITYYVQNETDNIHGPRNLTIDGQEIHVRFEPCHNYTYANDEPHPC